MAQGLSDNIQQRSFYIIKKLNCNFVLMCHMSGRLVVSVSQYLNAKQTVFWKYSNKSSSTIRQILPDVHILPDTGIQHIPVLHINMHPLIRLVLTGATAGLNVACKVGLGSGSGSGCGSGSSS